MKRCNVRVVASASAGKMATWSTSHHQLKYDIDIFIELA